MKGNLSGIACIIVALLILGSCLPPMSQNVRAGSINGEHILISPPTLPQPLKDWTVACYLAGDNDLEASLIDDINEMERVGSDSSKLNIVALLDRSEGYDTSNGDWTDTRRFYITYDSVGVNDPDDRTIRSWGESIGEANTGDPLTLINFFTWVKNNFPAKNYALILGDHGRGYKGVCWDDGITTYEEYITIPELGFAMEKISTEVLGGQRLDILGLDVCLGSSIEIMNVVSPYIDVFVASENVEPAGGWPYTPIFHTFKDFSINGPAWHAEFNIIPNYNTYIGRMDKTLSAYHGAEIQSHFLIELEEFADALCLDVGTYRTEVDNARMASQKLYGDEIVDIVDFCNHLRSMVSANSVIYSEAGDVISAHANSQIANIRGSEVLDANGVSIYVPDTILKFIQPSGGTDTGFDFYRETGSSWSNTWNTFIQKLWAGGDTTPPTITVNQATYGWYSSDPGNVINVDFDSGTTTSDADYYNSVLDYAQYKVGTAGTWRNIFTSNWGVYTGNWPIAWNDLQEGENIVYIRCADMAGNMAAATITVKKDTTGPVPQGVPTEGSPDMDWGNGEYTVYWEPAVDQHVSVAQYEIQENVNNGATWQTIGYSPTNSYSVTGRNIDGNFYRYRIRAQDTLGNWDGWSGASDGITMDLTPPDIPSTPWPMGTYYDGVTRWSDSSVTWGFTATDAGSGIGSYYVIVTRDSPDGPVVAEQWTTAGSFTIWGANGVTYFLKVKAMDKVGNVGTIFSSSSEGVTVDASPPANVEIISQNVFSLIPHLELGGEDAQSGMGQMRFANKGDVWWTEDCHVESAHDNDAGTDLWYEISHTGAQSMKVHFTKISTYESVISPKFSGEGNEIHVEPPPVKIMPDYVQIYDGDYNLVQEWFGITTILLDVWSVNIPGDTVRIRVFCQDGTEDTGKSWGFEVDKYSWFDPVKWGNWVPYSPSYQWQLEADPYGLYRVFFEVTDRVGNLAGHTTILNYLGIDSDPPSVSVTINNDAEYIASRTPYPPLVTLDLFAMDDSDGSGVKDFRWSTDGLEWSDWYDWPSDPGSGTGQSPLDSDVDPSMLTEDELAVWNYFVEGWYPRGAKVPENGFEPSRSLIEAMMLDGAFYYSGDDKGLFISDQKGGLFAGDNIEYRISVDAALEFTATLVWQDDYEPVLDDLDLIVIGPTGVVYRGNGLDDDYNRMEQVSINLPQIGIYKIRVFAQNLQLSKAVPFALVVSGGLYEGYGQVFLDRTRYDESDVMNIRIEDTNNPAPQALVTVVTSEGDIEVFNISWTQMLSGVFVGSMNLAYGPSIPGNNILEVTDGSSIMAVYSDGIPSFTNYAIASVDITLAPVVQIEIPDIYLGKYYGTKYASVQVRDRAGNIAQASDTIQFLNANLPRPFTEVLVYQDVNITLMMGGRKWNTVDLIIMEDGRPIDAMSVTRMPGDPRTQSRTISLKVISSIISTEEGTTSRMRDYELLVRYNGRHYGENPFKILFESGQNRNVVYGEFVYDKNGVNYMLEYISPSGDGAYLVGSNFGNKIEFHFAVNEVLNETLAEVPEFHFSTVSMSTCHWDFGDGTGEAVGENVAHTYSEPGVYVVTVTYRDDSGEIIAQVRFEVKVMGDG